jgi:hypothetical protein
MKKVRIVRDFREDKFAEKLEELLNTEEVIGIHYSSIGSIHIAIVIVKKEGKNGTKTTRASVQTRADSDDKRRRGSKEKDAGQS